MATKPSHILGMNSRYAYTRLNSAAAKKYGFSKLRTKMLLKEKKIPTAEIYHIFENQDQLEHVVWENMPVPFVIKPASGSAGKGIWVITQKLPDNGGWIDSDGETVQEEDLVLHVRNILEGEF